MDLRQLIMGRRIIKKFNSVPVEQNLLISWLDAAMMAPNHRMTEPWEIIFVGNETRAKLNHKSNFGNAPTVLAILSKHGATEVEKNENLVSVSCFIQNLMLLAWSEGVGLSWSSLGVTNNARNALNVSDGYDVVGIFGVGYPEEVPNAKIRTEIEKKIKYLS